MLEVGSIVSPLFLCRHFLGVYYLVIVVYPIYSWHQRKVIITKHSMKVYLLRFNLIFTLNGSCSYNTEMIASNSFAA